jgi:predicted nucleic acid-binding Zn ribbon protein
MAGRGERSFMTTIETYGKCKCGEFNSLGEVVCGSCGARLPWAPTPRGAQNVASKTASTLPPFIPGITTRAQTAQAGYWNTALTGQRGAPGYNDPDIDFSPLASSRAPHANDDADMYCTACGTGLKAGQTVCHRCRRLTNYTRADLRFSMLVSSLVVTGFVLGALWCAIIINFFHTGAWTMPGVSFNTTQKATPQKAPAKPAPKPTPVDDYGMGR